MAIIWMQALQHEKLQNTVAELRYREKRVADTCILYFPWYTYTICNQQHPSDIYNHKIYDMDFLGV